LFNALIEESVKSGSFKKKRPIWQCQFVLGWQNVMWSESETSTLVCYLEFLLVFTFLDSFVW